MHGDTALVVALFTSIHQLLVSGGLIFVSRYYAAPQLAISYT